jgi:hypothetical protein
MPDEIRENDEAIVNKALDGLMLHFDTAQVFVSRQDGSTTVGGGFGRGNHYARRGQVQEWLDNGCAMNGDGDEPEEIADE